MAHEGSTVNSRLICAVLITRWQKGGGEPVFHEVSVFASYPSCQCSASLQHRTDKRTKQPWTGTTPFSPLSCFPKSFLRKTAHVHTQIGRWLFMESPLVTAYNSSQRTAANPYGGGGVPCTYNGSSLDNKKEQISECFARYEPQNFVQKLDLRDSSIIPILVPEKTFF